MSTSALRSRNDQILYPDSDGQPMSDNTVQFRWIVLIKEGLEFLFRDRPDVFVAGDLLGYAEEGNPKARTAPDVMVAFGRPKGDRGSYKQWEEGGIAPQVVFEILSPGNRVPEMMRKFRIYEDRGVEEYYIYNPDDGDLQGWIQKDGRLQEVPDPRGWISPRLGVRFEPGEGPESLKILHPDGTPFKTALEMQEDAQAERLRADAAEESARVERLRAERLAARLRELGESAD
ncbi:Uma2 family endonuclease [Planctomyces sp. SH-PL62]|uniref:Uma2 family endonuclease n=1 Tax=Planctomyces sp. SH-PL62 TaxID=1636152 RepID=UPI0012E99126|nr:Uma2 family endonuclease [Planctomyces sp. SH-PL62]